MSDDAIHDHDGARLGRSENGRLDPCEAARPRSVAFRAPLVDRPRRAHDRDTEDYPQTLLKTPSYDRDTDLNLHRTYRYPQNPSQKPNQPWWT
jgi:hypothetical protein